MLTTINLLYTDDNGKDIFEGRTLQTAVFLNISQSLLKFRFLCVFRDHYFLLQNIGDFYPTHVVVPIREWHYQLLENTFDKIMVNLRGSFLLILDDTPKLKKTSNE